MKKLFLYRYKRRPLLFSQNAIKLIEAWKNGKNRVEISFDLGLSKTQVELSRDGVLINEFLIDWITITTISRDLNDNIYVLEGESIKKLSWYSNKHFYKLKLVKPDTAPTLEISGIHMHRVKDVTPWEDSVLKVKYLNIAANAKVLDICTGLGYTAILSLKKGAGQVISIEKDINVLRMAEYNPWSQELENKNISIFLGDAFEVLREFDNSSFNGIIHDPPRFSLAGNLYSLSFYHELYRVLKPEGILIHYVGLPRFRRGVDFTSGVLKRLREVGFKVNRIKEIQGVKAVKL
jgi:predicted methyltransferase